MTPQEIDTWAEQFVDYARDVFKTRGQVRPVAMLLATVNPTTREAYDQPTTAPVLFASKPGDLEMEALKHAAKSCRALAVVFVTEAWRADVSSSEEMEELRRKYSSVENFPNSREEVLVSYGRRGRTIETVWTIPIIRDGSEVRLGDTDIFYSDAGNMAEILSQETVN